MKRNRLIYALPLVAFMTTAALADSNYGDERRGATSRSDTTSGGSMSSDRGSMSSDRSSTSSDRSSTSSDRGSMSRDTDSSRTDSQSPMADAAITAKVKSALLSEPDLPSTQINVETTNGVVQLSGFLSSQSEIDRAVSVARNVEDVKSVENNIQTK